MDAIFEFLKEPERAVTLAFIIAVGILVWQGWGTILKMLDARAAKIAETLDEAAQLRGEAERLLTEYTAKHRASVAEAQAMLEHARTEAERFAKDAEAEFAASVKRREIAAADRIKLAEVGAVADVRRAAIDAAIRATRTLLINSLDAQRGGAMVDAVIADLPARLTTH